MADCMHTGPWWFGDRGEHGCRDCQLVHSWPHEPGENPAHCEREPVHDGPFLVGYRTPLPADLPIALAMTSSDYEHGHELHLCTWACSVFPRRDPLILWPDDRIELLGETLEPPRVKYPASPGLEGWRDIGATDDVPPGLAGPPGEGAEQILARHKQAGFRGPFTVTAPLHDVPQDLASLLAEAIRDQEQKQARVTVAFLPLSAAQRCRRWLDSCPFGHDRLSTAERTRLEAAWFAGRADAWRSLRLASPDWRAHLPLRTRMRQQLAAWRLDALSWAVGRLRRWERTRAAAERYWRRYGRAGW